MEELFDYIVIAFLIVVVFVFILYRNRNNRTNRDTADSEFDCIIISVGLAELLTAAQVMFNFEADNNGHLMFIWVMESFATALFATLISGCVSGFVTAFFDIKERNLKYWAVCLFSSIIAVAIMSLFLYYGADHDEQSVLDN